MMLHTRIAFLAVATLTLAAGRALGEDEAQRAGSGPSSKVTGKLGDAEGITNNPPGRYTARWAAAAGDAQQPFSGSVEAVSSPDGRGVVFTVNLRGLPAEGGPFSFHIHDQPKPADGDCNKTLAHLDPYQRGQTPACDSRHPQTCEVGDLSGKHGKVEGTAVEGKTFHDMYASLAPGIGAFLGNRSVVIHFANTTRFACANFVDESSGTSADRPRSNGRRWLSFLKAVNSIRDASGYGEGV